jgi:hypothetical protein
MELQGFAGAAASLRAVGERATWYHMTSKMTDNLVVTPPLPRQFGGVDRHLPMRGNKG